MTACPDKMLLLHGFVDGELDAANSLAIEAHLRGCAGCSEELERIDAVRARIAASDLAYRAPDALRARIEAALDAEMAPMPTAANDTAAPGRFRFAAGALTGLAAGVALMLAIPMVTQPSVQDQLVASHVRSLLAGHLTDVPTSDRHTVKPWFNGKIDYAPPVPELSEEGFPLAGGRLDYVDGRVVAAIVYHRRLHSINLFVRPAGRLSPPAAVTTHTEGYNLVHWSAGGLDFWAVSDLNTKELQQFQQLYAQKAA